MENTKNNNSEYVIDLVHILKYIWSRIWSVILACVITAVAGFCYASFLVTPTYSSSILLYVNNNSLSLNDVGFSLSSSDINASQSLVKTHEVLLKNRTTLQKVIDYTDAPYSWKELYNMVDTSSVNQTEVMCVEVVTTDPYMSEKIANGIAVILPQRITEVVEGTSMEVVDSAIPNLQKVAPSVSLYTILGFMLGAFVSIIILTIRALLDNTIHDEDYIMQNYDYPILAKIPDLLDIGNKSYGYKYGKAYKKHNTVQKQESDDLIVGE
ncbi:MAG: hypothetical protein E7560_06440 [Ruminococcaceae bacterium]|nr:hypothetical protein [Oscillospiraceae bacterium]